MGLRFATSELRELAESAQALDRAFGRLIGAKIRQRLVELNAAETVKLACSISYLGATALPGKRFAISISTTHRIVFTVGKAVRRGLSPLSTDAPATQDILILAIERALDDRG